MVADTMETTRMAEPVQGKRPLTRGRVQSRRARAAIFCGMAVFALSQLVLGVGIEQFWPELKDPPFGIKIKRLQRRLHRLAGPPPHLIVMLGSSRAAHGLDGQLLEENLALDSGRPVVIYNFGRNGGGPIAACFSLERLLAWHIRPSVVLVEVAPVLMSKAGSDNDMSTLQASRLDYLSLLRRFAPEAQPESPWWPNAAFPVFTYRQAILFKYVPFLLPGDIRGLCARRELNSSGWDPLPSPDTDEGQKKNEEATRKTLEPLLRLLKDVRYGPDLPACQALEEVLDLCRRQGMPTALVLMPEAPSLRSWYPEGSWESVVQYLTSLSQRYQCPLINAREWVATEQFTDPTHLAPSGARVFTRRFGREVLPALLRTPQQSRPPRE